MILGLIAHNKLFAGLAECYIHPRLVHVPHAIRQGRGMVYFSGADFQFLHRDRCCHPGQEIGKNLFFCFRRTRCFRSAVFFPVFCFLFSFRSVFLLSHKEWLRLFCGTGQGNGPRRSFYAARCARSFRSPDRRFPRLDCLLKNLRSLPSRSVPFPGSFPEGKKRFPRPPAGRRYTSNTS